MTLSKPRTTASDPSMFHQQVGIVVVDDESLPWIPFAPHAERVFVKYFRLDPLRGEVVVMVRAAAGERLPRQRHSGALTVYTIEGRWKCAEHDWIAGPGSVLFAPALVMHTPHALPGNGDTVVLSIVTGDVLLCDGAGAVIAVENWKTALQRYLDHCATAGITPRDLTAIG